MLTKPRSASRASNTSMYVPNRRRRLSPLMIIGISVPVLLVLIGAGVVVALPKLFSHAAAAPNPNCTIIVPANPLSAQGLATPYQLFAPDAAANGPCNEANVNQSAFVQGTIYDPATGKFSIYSPLVIDKGTKPAAAPVVPTLPANAVVGLWFGFNGTNLTLMGTNANTLRNARCVNGLNQSVFGQFAYCNAVNFFNAAKAGIQNGLVTVPPLGTAKDGMPCPTSRDFSVVDQDQSDNVQTQYLANANGQTAQLNTANQAAIANATTLGNPSDNALITKFIDPALGCTPWTAPDLANNGTPNLSLALDELQANALQAAPVALVPLTDPMTLNNNNASTQKTNRYRVGVNQPPINANNAALNGSGTTYCTNYLAGFKRLQGDMNLTINATSPAPAAANSLFTFLAMRANQAYGLLNCPNLIKVPNPIALTLDGNGVVTAATITAAGAATGNANGNGTTTGTTANQAAATGTANIVLDPQAGNATLTVNVTYANHPNAPITVNIVNSANGGSTVFNQTINTDNASQATFNTAINGLQGLTALPATWTLNILDPNMNNTVVGTGAVVANGVNGTVTIAAPAAANGNAANGNAANGNAANGQTTTTTSPAAPASAGQVTPKNAPYNNVAKTKKHKW